MTVRTVYCVQSYGGAPGHLVAGKLRQFGTSTEALEMGKELSARAPGVLVFEVSGEPDFDSWEEPKILARHGRLPSLPGD